MREPITDPDEKFKKWAMEKLARLEQEAKEKDGEMVTTAMGFTITKAKYEQQQKELAEREERARKLAEMRQKREKDGSKKKEKDTGKGVGLSPSPSPDSSPRSPGMSPTGASLGGGTRRDAEAVPDRKRLAKKANEGPEPPKGEAKKSAAAAGKGPTKDAEQRRDEQIAKVMPCTDLLTDLRPTLPGPDLGVEVRVRLAL